MSSSPGQRIRVPRGTLILREGELQACAYRIESGSVAVSKNMGGASVLLARLGPGEFFGEMSLILDTPRTACVRALEDCVLTLLSQDAFHELLVSEPEEVFPLLKLLFERLRVMNLKYAHAVEEQRRSWPLRARRQTPRPGDLRRPWEVSRPGSRIHVRGDTPAATLLVGEEGLVLDRLPFRIGRNPRPDAGDVFVLNDICFEDQPPFQVSRNHCAIDEKPDGSRVVLDRGSTLGTIVNGETIGAAFGKLEATLQDGDNNIILGTPNSPFRLTVSVSPVG